MQNANNQKRVLMALDALMVAPDLYTPQFGIYLGLHRARQWLARPADKARLIETAQRTGRILQVGHLERFNPAIIALTKVITHPLFFEIHRMSEFSPRSLDIDVVFDVPRGVIGPRGMNAGHARWWEGGFPSRKIICSARSRVMSRASL